MATLRTYSTTIEQSIFKDAAVARLRLDETTGVRVTDTIDGLGGRLEGGFVLGQPGTIGDGAIRFNGTGRALLSGQVDGVPTIAAFGDSLVANVEVTDVAERFAPQLERSLSGEGISTDVQGFGVSGESFGDTLARIDTVLTVDPDLVIVVFGTNDSRQERPLAEVEADMRDLVGQLTDSGAAVLLTGTFGFYPGSGDLGYPTVEARDAFEALFAEVATDVEGVTLLRDAAGNDKYLGGERVETESGTEIQGGVLDSDDPSLRVDPLHPNAAGVDQIVDRLLAPTIDLLGGDEATTLDLPEGSVEMWLTPEAIGGQQILFARNIIGFNDGDVEAEFVDGALRVSMQDSAGGTFQVNSAAAGIEAQAGEPLHVVFTFGSRGMRLFVDGELVDQNDFTGGLVNNGVPFSIAAANEGVDFLTGTVDEFALYDRAFGEGKVMALFESGSRGSRLVGTADADELIGGVDDERLEGRGGADLILGGAGDDVLLGGGHADDLFGNGGNDRLDGGSGLDTLRGNGGSDTFVLGPQAGEPDRILDFQTGPVGDILELGDFLDTVSADLLRLRESGSDTRLEVDPGTGFTAGADLVGTTGLDLDQLIADGNIVAA